MNADLLKELRRELEATRSRQKAEIAELREAAKATTYLEDESDAVDQHMADDASVLTERQTDMSLQQNLEIELASVESALQRVDQGTYGTCEVCGKPIPEARLRARPASTTCIECQTAIEKSANRANQPA